MEFESRQINLAIDTKFPAIILAGMKSTKRKIILSLIHPTLLFSAILILVVGCATSGEKSASKPQIQYPSTARGWNGMDSVEFLQPYKLAGYETLFVEPIDTSGAILPPKEENTYKPVTEVLRKLDALTVPEYEKRLKQKIRVTTKKPEPASTNHLVLKVKLTEFNPGSAAARFWVGFGAGSGWVRMHAELIDSKTQKTLFKVDQRRISSMRLDYAGMLASCAREVADDFAKTIIFAESK